MLESTNKFGELLSDEQRLTPFGKILRSTSIDELPELINVLKGDMSFIGHRPKLVKDVIFYEKDVISGKTFCFFCRGSLCFYDDGLWRRHLRDGG